MTRCGVCDGCRWGGRCTSTMYRGAEPLTDLHDGRGTSWIRTPDGEYYPDCTCHGPQAGRTTARSAAKAPNAASQAIEAGSEALTDREAIRLVVSLLRRLSRR